MIDRIVLFALNMYQRWGEEVLIVIGSVVIILLLTLEVP
jgi:hypothetical protein